MPKKDSPTPYLKENHAQNKMFTYAENRLLDQITLEVTEAWKKDLKVLREHYRVIEKTGKSTKDIVDILENELPKLQKFIESNEFIEDFKSMKLQWDSINVRLGEIDKYIFELDKKLNFEYVKSLMESIKTMEEMIKYLHGTIKLPWWKRIFK